MKQVAIIRHARRVAIALSAFAATGTANAMSTCDGSYAAALLQPLPVPMVVGLDIRDDSPANLRLGERFVAGLREAGVVVGTPPNVVLHVGTLRISGGGRQAGDDADRTYSETSGVEGGLQYDAPGVSGDPLEPAAPPPRPLLTLRIEATEAQAPRISWVGTVQCGLVGSDDDLRAQELGRAIGAVIGQRVDRRPL